MSLCVVESYNLGGKIMTSKTLRFEEPQGEPNSPMSAGQKLKRMPKEPLK